MAASPAEGGPRVLGTLELGRFVAAATVTVTHVFATMPVYARRPEATFFASVAPPGALAVQFFFVLSGFVMAVAHGADRGADWKVAGRFLWRRACRIYPMYWLALLLAATVLGLPRGWHAVALVSLWPQGTVEDVPPAWTLRYEVEFYGVFALVLLPRVGTAIGLAWLAGTAANGFIPFECRAYGIATPPLVTALSAPAAGHLFSGVNLLFVAGVAAGTLHRRRSVSRAASAMLAMGGALIVCACLPWLRWGHDFGQTPFLPPVVGAGLGAMLLGFGGLERAGVLRTGRWALRAGAVSYPLYILHAVLVLLLGAALRGVRLDGAGVYALAAGLLLGILVVSAAAAFGIDQPLQRRLRRRVASPARPTAFDGLVGEERG